jgi:hypothetical protein
LNSASINNISMDQRPHCLPNRLVELVFGLVLASPLRFRLTAHWTHTICTYSSIVVLPWRIETRVAIFRENNYSAEHRTDGNFDLFHRSSAYSILGTENFRNSDLSHSAEDKNVQNSVTRNFVITFLTIPCKI